MVFLGEPEARHSALNGMVALRTRFLGVATFGVGRGCHCSIWRIYVVAPSFGASARHWPDGFLSRVAMTDLGHSG
jgi:hypothetical protein